VCLPIGNKKVIRRGLENRFPFKPQLIYFLFPMGKHLWEAAAFLYGQSLRMFSVSRYTFWTASHSHAGERLSKECTGTLPENNRPYILYGSQSVPIMGNVLFKEILDSAPIQELFSFLTSGVNYSGWPLPTHVLNHLYLTLYLLHLYRALHVYREQRRCYLTIHMLFLYQLEGRKDALFACVTGTHNYSIRTLRRMFCK